MISDIGLITSILFIMTIKSILNYELKYFEQLNIAELYEILALRAEVFIVEQDCPYQDLDGKDKLSWHLLGYDVQGVLVSYARIVPPSVSYEGFASLGRIVTAKSIRRSGGGMELVTKAIDICHGLYPQFPIKISAQYYLLKFYKKCGFEEVGKTYLEDNIPHIAMIRPIKMSQ